MKIEQAEIDEFMAEYAKHRPNDVLWQGTVMFALEAAYRARKSRKKAKRDAKLPSATKPTMSYTKAQKIKSQMMSESLRKLGSAIAKEQPDGDAPVLGPNLTRFFGPSACELTDFVNASIAFHMKQTKDTA